MNKKNVIFTVAIMLFTILSVTNVFAATTEYITAPSLKPEGTTVKGSVRGLTGSTKTAQGSNCNTYFKFEGTISVDLHPWTGRIMTMALYEDDALNSDDKIKVYKAKFAGRSVDTVTITNYITGDVEDSGDGKAELYLTFYIQKNSEDNDNAYTGNFFKYKLENK